MVKHYANIINLSLGAFICLLSVNYDNIDFYYKNEKYFWWNLIHKFDIDNLIVFDVNIGSASQLVITLGDK